MGAGVEALLHEVRRGAVDLRFAFVDQEVAAREPVGQQRHRDAEDARAVAVVEAPAAASAVEVPDEGVVRQVVLRHWIFVAVGVGVVPVELVEEVGPRLEVEYGSAQEEVEDRVQEALQLVDDDRADAADGAGRDLEDGADHVDDRVREVREDLRRVAAVVGGGDDDQLVDAAVEPGVAGAGRRRLLDGPVLRIPAGEHAPHVHADDVQLLAAGLLLDRPDLGVEVAQVAAHRLVGEAAQQVEPGEVDGGLDRDRILALVELGVGVDHPLHVEAEERVAGREVHVRQPFPEQCPEGRFADLHQPLGEEELDPELDPDPEADLHAATVRLDLGTGQDRRDRRVDRQRVGRVEAVLVGLEELTDRAAQVGGLEGRDHPATVLGAAVDQCLAGRGDDRGDDHVEPVGPRHRDREAADGRQVEGLVDVESRIAACRQ